MKHSYRNHAPHGPSTPPHTLEANRYDWSPDWYTCKIWAWNAPGWIPRLLITALHHASAALVDRTMSKCGLCFPYHEISTRHLSTLIAVDAIQSTKQCRSNLQNQFYANSSLIILGAQTSTSIDYPDVQLQDTKQWAWPSYCISSLAFQYTHQSCTDKKWQNKWGYERFPNLILTFQ